MAYVPPLYDAVNFTLRPIVIPLPGIVNFALTGEGADVGIYPGITHLNIYSDSVYILDGTFITSYSSVINVFSDFDIEIIKYRDMQPWYIFSFEAIVPYSNNICSKYQ